MTLKGSTTRGCDTLRAVMVGCGITASALLVFGCDAKNEDETVAVTPEAQEVREQAGLRPVDERPVVVPGVDAGTLGADDPRLRQKAGLKPVGGEDYAQTPQQLRERLDLHPDKKAPPESEAEMRKRMDLHPERVEEKP